MISVLEIPKTDNDVYQAGKAVSSRTSGRTTTQAFYLTPDPDKPGLYLIGT